MMPKQTTTTPIRDNWRPLRFLNLYRMTLAGLLTVLSITGSKLPVLGSSNPQLFEQASIVFLAASILFSFAIRHRWLPFAVQLNLHMFVDISVITLLMHASGSITSGLGVLLVVSIGAGSLMASRRIAVLYASIATIALLGEQGFNSLYSDEEAYYTHSGILGATLFATALLANALAKRVVESEALVARHSVDLANLEQLNEYIIQHMQTGIVVIDTDNNIRLMNESAWLMLDMPAAFTGKPVQHASEALAEQLVARQKDSHYSTRPFRSSNTSPTIMPKFARLGSNGESGALVFLEDMSATAQQAQQMKLASLGRLTASIAHEIRNPLGAISHAGQLLSESSDMNSGDRRLTQIILDHAMRMNTIIENVMQLSRRDRAEPVLFDLHSWLEDFREEFIRNENISAELLAVTSPISDIKVRIDPSQLHQVVWNLCRNGLRHSADYPGVPKVELQTSKLDETNSPYLDIIDHGPGIDSEKAEHIFEPFYTTEAQGTGLGLYIARELCEGNQARLDYIAVPEGGSCFRITFADPRRRQDN